MSVSRTRNLQHKVYIPSSARENQYLMAKIPLTDELLASFDELIAKGSETPFEALYQHLSDSFFKATDKSTIESAQFIANDKFPRVRYSPEKLTAQTKQQVLFLYDPKFHTSRNTFVNGANKAKKITLIFLANGDDIRVESAKFHNEVKNVLLDFAKQTNIDISQIRVCDHQHLTYDLFAKNKGIEGSQSHKFRSMTDRYLADKLQLPQETDALTYAVVDLPLNRRIRSLVTIDDTASDKYIELYNLVADAFINSAKQHNLHNGAVIANGLVPIVRRAEDENVIKDGELLMLGYNPKHSSGGYTCKWDANKLVDSIQLIFVASEQDKTSHGYGKFVNQIQQALSSFAKQLDYVVEKEELILRLHQHIGFYLEK
ncbi:DUF3083 family protein [Litorilituus lipolyticus]|uniref:DUF3083 family protein n=1 Tax=Litorilituus lipolyticus TaxID=2491017 RepID=A0A502KS34_9GAMM|nr:DUF3083 family protein [Litorilituus lipolyticus]TPH12841.1 DUF3083 family protein [Litorilituus lipolyticus]